MSKPKGKNQVLIDQMLLRLQEEVTTELSEKAILGAALVYDAAFAEVLSIMSPEDFATSKHRHIMEAIREVNRRGGTSDPMAVATILANGGNLANAGGVCYLSELIRWGCAPGSVRFHAAEVWEGQRWREVYAEMARCKDEFRSVEDFLEAAKSEKRRVDARGGKERLGKVARERLAAVDEALKQGRKLTGIRTGIRLFDWMTGGLQPTNYIVIGGRPKMGKTALMLEMAIGTAICGTPVFIASQEMSKEELSDRATSAQAGVAANAIRTGNVNSEILENLKRAAEDIDRLDIEVEDTKGMRVRDLFRLARDLPKDGGVVFVDYLQLLKPDDAKVPREQQVSTISRQLKAAAGDTRLPWVVAAQLKRPHPSAGKNPRPVMSDLRESGSLEQDPDLIAFVYREDYEKETPGVPSDLEFIIAGNRHGPTGTIPLKFYRDVQRIVGEVPQ